MSDGAAAIRVPTLRGQRCVLRALTLADAPSLQRHADDPAVAFNLFDAFPQPYTLADAEAWCGEMAHAPRFGHVWGIVPEGDGVAGCVSVLPERGLWACSAVVGYWIGQAHWRRGIVGEALRLVTDWAWANLPQTTRLYAPIYARNAGSQGVARKAGYTLEGRLPRSVWKNGEAIDAVLFGCYRPVGEAAT